VFTKLALHQDGKCFKRTRLSVFRVASAATRTDSYHQQHSM